MDGFGKLTTHVSHVSEATVCGYPTDFSHGLSMFKTSSALSDWILIFVLFETICA